MMPPEDSSHSSLPLEISVHEARRQLEEGGVHVRLIDVRDPEEFAFNHLPGAQHIPLQTITQEAPAKLMHKEAEILVYCHHGMRSAQAAQILRQLGYTKVYSIAGGVDKWSTEIDPTLPRY